MLISILILTKQLEPALKGVEHQNGEYTSPDFFFRQLIIFHILSTAASSFLFQKRHFGEPLFEYIIFGYGDIIQHTFL
jgi:hypothetical protein